MLFITGAAGLEPNWNTPGPDGGAAAAGCDAGLWPKLKAVPVLFEDVWPNWNGLGLSVALVVLPNCDPNAWEAGAPKALADEPELLLAKDGVAGDWLNTLALAFPPKAGGGLAASETLEPNAVLPKGETAPAAAPNAGGWVPNAGVAALEDCAPKVVEPVFEGGVPNVVDWAEKRLLEGWLLFDGVPVVDPNPVELEEPKVVAGGAPNPVVVELLVLVPKLRLFALLLPKENGLETFGVVNAVEAVAEVDTVLLNPKPDDDEVVDGAPNENGEAVWFVDLFVLKLKPVDAELAIVVLSAWDSVEFLPAWLFPKLKENPPGAGAEAAAAATGAAVGAAGAAVAVLVDPPKLKTEAALDGAVEDMVEAFPKENNPEFDVGAVKLGIWVVSDFADGWVIENNPEEVEESEVTEEVDFPNVKPPVLWAAAFAGVLPNVNGDDCPWPDSFGFKDVSNVAVEEIGVVVLEVPKLNNPGALLTAGIGLAVELSDIFPKVKVEPVDKEVDVNELDEDNALVLELESVLDIGVEPKLTGEDKLFELEPNENIEGTAVEEVFVGFELSTGSCFEVLSDVWSGMLNLKDGVEELGPEPNWKRGGEGLSELFDLGSLEWGVLEEKVKPVEIEVGELLETEGILNMFEETEESFNNGFDSSVFVEFSFFSLFKLAFKSGFVCPLPNIIELSLLLDFDDASFPDNKGFKIPLLTPLKRLSSLSFNDFSSAEFNNGFGELLLNKGFVLILESGWVLEGPQFSLRKSTKELLGDAVDCRDGGLLNTNVLGSLVESAVSLVLSELLSSLEVSSFPVSLSFEVTDGFRVNVYVAVTSVPSDWSFDTEDDSLCALVIVVDKERVALELSSVVTTAAVLAVAAAVLVVDVAVKEVENPPVDGVPIEPEDWESLSNSSSVKKIDKIIYNATEFIS